MRRNKLLETSKNLCDVCTCACELDGRGSGGEQGKNDKFMWMLKFQSSMLVVTKCLAVW